MKRREQELLDGDLLNAAVLLDVLNADLLSDRDQQGGKTLVCNLVLKMKGLDSEEGEEPGLEVLSTGAPYTDSDEEMRALRGNASSLNSSVNSETETEVSDGLSCPHRSVVKVVEDALTTLKDSRNKFKRLNKPLTTLIMEDYPKELREVALLLQAMPVTQVSVERLFSSLQIIKNERRSQLKEDVLEAILVLKANK